MKNKSFLWITLPLFLLFFPRLQVYAAEALPEEYATLGERLSYPSVFGTIFGVLREALSPALLFFAGMAALLLLCTLMQTSGIRLGGRDVGALASAACLAGYTFSTVRALSETVEAYITSLTGTMTALLPSMMAVSAADGILAAGVGYTGTVAALNVIGLLVSRFVFPAVRLLFVFAVLSIPAGEWLELGSLNAALRRVTVWTLSLCMTAVVTVMHFQTVLASAADSLTSHAVRFASVSFIPLVGALVSDSLRTVSAGMHAVRSITGVFGAASLLSISLPPLCAVMIYKAGFSLCAALAKTLGCKREGAFLDQINGLFNMLNAAIFAGVISFLLIIGMLAGGLIKGGSAV